MLKARTDKSLVFPPSQVFAQLYKEPCAQALHAYSVNAAFNTSFLTCLKQAFEDGYETVASGTSTAVAWHLARLLALRPCVAQLRCNTTCLLCIMHRPEKVLACGHAICDDCIRTFGSRSLATRYSFHFAQCPLCGAANENGSFQLMPPTAGPRILTLDGGGVKGIIPITLLCCIEQQLAWLGCPLRDHFDLVCGTSSGMSTNSVSYHSVWLTSIGGLIILGLFIMRWSAQECSEKFVQLASTIFRKRTQGLFIFSKIQQYLMSYLADCKYDSIDIERALYSVFGKTTSLFNPLCTDTKVAVTSTTARDSMPCLFANYNGGSRPKEAGT